MELMIVIAIMTVVSLGVMQDKIAETAQLRAKTLGNQIATIATALESYTTYYSGAASATGSPSSGSTKTGINFLKSNTCSGSETTSRGQISVGFLPDCGFLSNLSSTDRDQKTTFGNLGFKTTFTRSTASAGNPGTILRATTVLDPLTDPNGNIMMRESGLAALVAGGMTTSNPGGAGYRVVYCVTTGGGDATYNQMCSGNAGKIVIMTSADATANIWLRTDGQNTMNNLITFGTSVSSNLRGIANINKLVLPSGSSTLSIEQNSTAFVDIGTSNVKIINSNLAVSGTGNVEVQGTGYIKSNTSVVAKTSMQSDVYLPYLGSGNEKSTTSGYRMEIDGRTELKDVGLNGLYLGTNTNRSNTKSGARIVAKNNTEVEFASNTIEINPVTSSQTAANLTGDVNVANLNVKMLDGNTKSLSELLPRYTLLAVTPVTGQNASANRVYKSTYTALGCDVDDLKPVLVPTGMNIQGYLKTDGEWAGFNATSVDGITVSGQVYSITDPGSFITYGEVIAYVSDYTTYWRPIIDGLSVGAKHSQRYQFQNRYGNGLLHVYCQNDVAKTLD